MTPPKKVVHHGRVKTTVGQVLALAEALRGLNPDSDAEVEIKMSFRVMEARVSTTDGISLGQIVGTVDGDQGLPFKVTPVSPTA